MTRDEAREMLRESNWALRSMRRKHPDPSIVDGPLRVWFAGHEFTWAELFPSDEATEKGLST